MSATSHVGQASRLPSVISALLATMIGFILLSAHGENSESEREKPVKAHVKIFNASLRNGVERWETGLDLEFRNERLATDVRVGRGGLVRTIEFTSKDTVDVRRHQEFLTKKRQGPPTLAASVSTSFPKGSVTLLVVHGVINPEGERLQIDAIREFPVPEESRRPGFARFVVWNFRPGRPVFLAIGDLPPFELPYRGKREFFLNPVETEIFLIYKNEDQIDFRRQLAAFNFRANRNYTGIISPASEIPDRPLLRISDSNEEWEGITAPPSEEKSE